MLRAKSKLSSASATFKRSNTTEPPPAHHRPPHVPNKTHFLASPQLILGEEIVHFSHPHRLSKIDLPDLFTCAGCKEYGAGKRFTCQICDYQMHDFCGLAPRTLMGHPFHYQHKLAFHSKPVKGGISKSKCTICAKPIKGYNFRCTAAGCPFQIHTACSILKDDIIFPTHPHPLNLVPSSAPPDPSSFTCVECNRKRPGRVFKCTVCDHYYVHAVCAKGIVSGLAQNGFKGREKSGNLIGEAGRIVSRVVVEFIGGLIEGIGEGVGEVFIQSIARGMCYSRKTRTDD